MLLEPLSKTTLGATPSQLVFGRDAIINETFLSDWDTIRAKKQKVINANNSRENLKRTPHTYQVGDMIMIKTESNTKYGQDPYEGPYNIVQVNDNGTVKYNKGSILDTINIRNVHPFKN